GVHPSPVPGRLPQPRPRVRRVGLVLRDLPARGAAHHGRGEAVAAAGLTLPGTSSAPSAPPPRARQPVARSQVLGGTTGAGSVRAGGCPSNPSNQAGEEHGSTAHAVDPCLSAFRRT